MAQTRDVIDILAADHRVIRELIAQLDAADRPGDMRHLYLRIVDELAAHEAAEEEVIFPVVRARFDTSARVGEHMEVDDLLDEMRRLAPSCFGFAKRAGALVLAIGAHLDAEEEALVPVLWGLSPEERVELGERVIRTKERAPAFRDRAEVAPA